MSLKPVSPTRRPGRPTRLATAPVVIVNKKNSGSGTWVVIALLLALLGGGYYFYSSAEAEKAAIAQKREAAAAHKAEQERRIVEQKRQHEAKRAARGIKDSALGATAPAAYTPSSSSTATSSASSSSSSVSVYDEAESAEEVGTRSALGGTAAPTAGTGEFAVTDTSPAPFDLKATGAEQKKVISKIEAAMHEASEGDTFHDLQADLQRSFEVALPERFSDSATLPPFPEKEEKLLRLAQGVYICLSLAAEVQLDKEIAPEKHAKFVNWLMKDKGKASRTFTYGLEHYNINDTAEATELLSKLRDAYIKSPSGAMDKIPAIVKPKKTK